MRWTDLSLRTKGLVFVAIPVVVFVGATDYLIKPLDIDKLLKVFDERLTRDSRELQRSYVDD